MADQNPFQQFGSASPINDIRSQRYAMAMMSQMNRMDPFHSMRSPRSGRSALGDNPMMGAMMDAPDYSVFTNDPQAHQAASQYLGQFGLSPLSQDQVNPNAIFPNSGIARTHPRLARMLEGGLFGAAATRSGDTIGENISNVAGGLIEGRQARQAMINRQYARPFQAASMLEGMRDMTQKRELQDAEIQHYRAMNEHMKNADELGIQRVEATRPVPVQGGAYEFNPTEGKWDFSPGAGKAMPTGGHSDARAAYEAQAGSEPAPGGPTDKNGLTAQQRWGKGFEGFMARLSGERTGAGLGAQEGHGKILDSKEQAKLEGLKKQRDHIDSTESDKEYRREALSKGTKINDIPDYITRRKAEDRSNLNQQIDDLEKGPSPLPKSSKPTASPQTPASPKKTGGSLADQFYGPQAKASPGPGLTPNRIDYQQADANNRQQIMDMLAGPASFGTWLAGH